MVKYNRALDATFQALADPTRRAIVAALARGQASVTELARPYRMSLPAVMKHLRVLEKAGLVTQKKFGRTRRCRLAARPLKKAEAWISQYRAFWETQFDALDRYLAQQPTGGSGMAKEQLSPETSLKLRRTFQAPRERVFRAWTDPLELGRWFAPSEEYSALVPVLELQVGGKYCVEMHHKGGNVHRVSGTYREIKPPEKIAFTWLWEHDPGKDESLVTIEFRDLGPSTEILLTHEHLPNAEQRDKHEHGWQGCINSLANYLNM